MEEQTARDLEAYLETESGIATLKKWNLTSDVEKLPADQVPFGHLPPAVTRGLLSWLRYLVAVATAGLSSGSTWMMPAKCVLPTQNFTCSPESSTNARRMFVSRGMR
jgi:hypothetical protein